MKVRIILALLLIVTAILYYFSWRSFDQQVEYCAALAHGREFSMVTKGLLQRDVTCIIEGD
jgi:hypothetical protein